MAENPITEPKSRPFSMHSFI